MTSSAANETAVVGATLTSANLGVRPGAEVLIATPLGAVRYGDAALDLSLDAQGLRVRVKQGEAWVEPEERALTGEIGFPELTRVDGSRDKRTDREHGRSVVVHCSHEVLQKGDTVVGFKGRPISTVDDLHKNLVAAEIGIASPIMFLRGTEKLFRMVVPRELPPVKRLRQEKRS